MNDDAIDPQELSRTPMLRFRRGEEGFRVRMHRRKLLVGRGAECDVVLPRDHAEISRRHLLLQRRGCKVLASNLGRHGTRLNDEPLLGSPRALEVGDRVEVGSWSVEVDPRPSEPAPPTTAPWSEEPRSDDAPDHGLIGRSPGMARLRQDIDQVADLELPVLILGETGSGKERVARALHDASRRTDGPFVAVNCGALLGDTARSEIFGHARGAFTGADRARAGAFVEADRGTLFLDEIGELSSDLQAALLRTLDLGEVVPVGSTRPLRPNVRVIAATHRDLRDAEAFRQDLLYRLDVGRVLLPPLRERGDDILRLARHFLAESARGPTPTLSPEAEGKLLGHPWPGNVRELRNCLLRAAMLAGGGRIEAEHLSLRPPRRPAPLSRPSATAWAGDSGTLAWPGRSAETERRALIDALRACGGNRARAARMLGVARSTLYERIKRHGIIGARAGETEP